MPIHRVNIKIIESGGSPLSKKAMIRVIFEWELKKPIPIMKWNNVFLRGWTNARIGDIGEGNWGHSLLGEINFTEWHKTGGGILGPTYELVEVFEFHDIPFRFEFPFKKGMKGKGMYHLYHTPFFHGGIDWEVV